MSCCFKNIVEGKKTGGEIITQKEESGDVAENMVESPLSKPAKAKYPGNLAPEKKRPPKDPMLIMGRKWLIMGRKWLT